MSTAPMPGVSVVIPHYGDPAPTLSLVEALKAQRGVDALQLVVADDCSPEPFPAVDGVTLVRRSSNGGFGSAVNSGAAEAIHERLLILNSDLEIDDDFVATMIGASEPWMPAVTGPCIVDHQGRYAWSARQFPTVSHQFVEWLTPLARWRGHRLLHNAVGHDVRCGPGVATSTDWLVGAALYLPTGAFRAAGGFDESFHMNSEEIDLQQRLRIDGVPSIFLGNVSVTHEGGGSTSDTGRRRRWLVASRLRYAEKWGSKRALQGALTFATAANFVHNTVRRLLGRAVLPAATASKELALIWRNLS